MAYKYIPITLFATVALSLLDKPPLHGNLGYCNQPLSDTLPLVDNTITQWEHGWLPQDCVYMIKKAGLDPEDVIAFNVQYTDCSDAWILCYHQGSPNPFQSIVDNLGRLPVRTRQWVRHVIILPDKADHAYNLGGSIAMFNKVDASIVVLLHESAHSLDLLGAYTDKPLSSSQTWLNSYNQDSNVPDPYSRSNQIENVAQNTVVASFNENVVGGFRTIEPNFMNISHQMTTLQNEANSVGSLLRPGGRCTMRLTNSKPIQVRSEAVKRRTISRVKRGVVDSVSSPSSSLTLTLSSSSNSNSTSNLSLGSPPDVSLSSGIAVIEPVVFDTSEFDCAHNTLI